MFDGLWPYNKATRFTGGSLLKEGKVFMKKIFLSALLILFLISCATAPEEKSNLTFGMVKEYLVKGQTGQEEVLRIFGAPNIITKRPGKRETWVYEKVSHESSSSKGFFGICGLFGSSKAQSGSKTMTVMLYFDEHDTFSDYSIMETHY